VIFPQCLKNPPFFHRWSDHEITGIIPYVKVLTKHAEKKTERKAGVSA
jgi:hypothetical protein